MGERGRVSCSLVNCSLHDKVQFWLVRSFRFIHLDSFISVQVCEDEGTRVVEARGYRMGRPVGAGSVEMTDCSAVSKVEKG